MSSRHKTPRATAEALGVPMYSTMGVPASSAMVPKSPAVEATPMDPLWWGPSSWPPGSPVVDNVGIVTARAVVEAAGPDEKLTREVPLSRGFSVARNRKESLAEYLLRSQESLRGFSHEESLERSEESLVEYLSFEESLARSLCEESLARRLSCRSTIP